MNKVQINTEQSVVDYEIREEQFDGRTHMVVPTVMMAEGVHAGSRGPVFHSKSSLSQFTEAWNGIPVVVYHPQKDQTFVSANSPEMLEQCVGRVFNTHVDDGKLKAEVWLDKEKLQEVNQLAFDYIVQKRAMDVSVGVYTEEIKIPETQWNGETYSVEATNYRPDHLALLPGEQGACGWADGCGIRTNMKQNNKQKGGSENVIEVNNELKTNLQKQGILLTQVQGEWREVMDAVRAKLMQTLGDDNWCYIEAMYDDYFIYEVEKEQKSYKQKYIISDNEVTFVDDPKEVKKVIQFINVNAKEEKPMANEKKPCCPERVDELIANKASKFTEADREFLLTQSEEMLEKFQPVVEKPAPLEVNKQQAMEVLKKEGFKDEQEFLDFLPAGEMKQMMINGLNKERARKTELVEQLVANEEAGWTKEELTAMSLIMLEKINKTVGTPAVYVGGGNPMNVNQNAPEALYPAGVEVK